MPDGHRCPPLFKWEGTRRILCMVGTKFELNQGFVINGLNHYPAAVDSFRAGFHRKPRTHSNYEIILRRNSYIRDTFKAVHYRL